MKLSHYKQFDLLAWAGVRCGAESWPNDSFAIGVFDNDDVLRAVFVFNAFYDHGASVHVASDGSKAWAHRRVFEGLYNYAFDFRRLARLECRISADNVDALIFTLKYGFQIEGRLRSGAIDGTDAILMSLHAANTQIGKVSHRG